MSGSQRKGAGRPTKYKKDFARQAQKMCQLGATDYDLAEFFEVDVSTIWRWRTSYSEFCSAVKIGKDACDDRVERSLYQRAVGYTFNTEKIFHFQGHITRAETLEHVPPDPGAAINWLKNRRRAEWSDRVELDAGEGFAAIWSAISAGQFAK